MNKHRLCCFLELILVLCLICKPQKVFANDLLKTEYSYRQYTIRDGLPEMICLGLYQDSKGFIWIGLINGFSRYDGHAFHSFLADSDEAVFSFSEDNKGNISGIAIRRSHQVSTGADSVRSHRVAPSIEDKYSYIISKSMPVGYGVYQIRDSRAIFSFTDSGLVKVWEHEKLNKMSEGQKPYWDKINKRFLIPTLEGTYVIGEDGIIMDSFATKTINCFVPHKGGFWAVADDGLYEYDNHVLKCILKYPFYTGNLKDYSILEDANGNLVIRTENTIFRYADNKLEAIVSSIAQTNDMHFDREGNLWVATAEGVYNFYRLNFKNHIVLTKENYVRSVLIDKQNRVWLASIQGDLVLLSNGKAEKIDYPVSPHKFTFFDEGSIIDGDDIYLTGGGGVLHYDINLRKFKWLDLPEDLYFHIVPLPNGDMAIGNFEVTYIYRPDKGIVRQYDLSITKQMSICAIVDKQERILLGGTKGVVVIDGDSIGYITDEKLDMCRNIVYDHSGKLWLTCRNNLVSMNGDQCNVAHTFPNTLIRSIYFTRNNVMVVATIDAIYLSKNTSSDLEFIRYDQYNGFNGLGTLTASMAEDEKGNVWLLTLGGSVRFNPEELLREQPTPLLYVQTMQSSADNIDWMNIEGDHSEWGYKDNNVRFGYVALCYSSTGNIRYQYRLKGFQENWSQPTPEREVTFNNLSPGHYEFQLKANAGTNDTETAVISQYFTIRPAFWQTWWFIVVVVLLLMLASTGIALLIQRRKNNRLIERLETEKQLNELRVKSIRLRSIPHFNANVLAAIEYYVMNLSKDDANRLLNIYSEFTSRTLREVDKASRSLNDELDYVQLYLKLEKLRFMEKFNYEVDIDPEVKQDVQLPNMILHTYCENAVKHGFSGRTSGCRLKISAHQKADVVEVRVEDNGVGRAAAAQNKNIRSTKQGLDILSRQIEIYNRFNKKKIVQQVIDLYDGDTPCGTCFMIEVPYGFVYQ